MDPVSALGVAAAAVQFLQFSLQVLDTCRQIRETAECSTTQNRDLERAIRTIKESRRELEASKAVKVPKRIAEVTQECVRDSDELVRVLERVRGAGKSISAWKATLRTMRERKTIEKLKNSLNEKQQSLDRLLLQGIWTRAELTTIEQRADHEKLNHGVQTLIRRLLNVSQDLASLRQLSQTRFDDSDGLMTKRFEQVEAHADVRQRETEQNAHQRYMRQEVRRQHDKMLTSLFFDDMHIRRAAIQDAAPETLQWIFGTHGTASVQWDDFAFWLRDDTSTCYWISGKLGSGKSTLMAHLVDYPRTLRELRSWSRGLDLHILSFYFWRSGSTLQKSILGLLRSLLYQVCQEQPDVVPVLLSHLKTSVDRLGTWTERSLRTSIINAISSARDVRFCVFIDGLDEYVSDGGYDELTDLVFDLAVLPNAKCCVASRPEVPLSKKFDGCQKLRLEHLNFDDIEKFVQQKLDTVDLEPQVKDRLAHDVTQRAQGVFLWASLVTRDLIAGFIAGDDTTMLYQRLDTVPEKMDDLFRTMLARVDRVHRKSLAFYLAATMVPSFSWIRTVPCLAATDMDTEVGPLDEFSRRCRQVEARIVSRSAGLLELQGGGLSQQSADYGNHGSDPKSKINHVEQFGADQPNHLLQLDQYESCPVSFVHRSAHDFVRDIDHGQILGEDLPDSVDVAEKLWKGACRYLSARSSFLLPGCAQYGPTGSTIHGAWIQHIITSVTVVTDDLKDDARIRAVAARALDDVRRRTEYDTHLGIMCDNNRAMRQPRTGPAYTPSELFWVACGNFGPHWYITSRLDLILDNPKLQNALSTCLLDQGPQQWYDRPWSLTIARKVAQRLRARSRCDPHQGQASTILQLVRDQFQLVHDKPSSISLDHPIHAREGDEEFQIIADLLSYAAFAWDFCPNRYEDFDTSTKRALTWTRVLEEAGFAPHPQSVFLGSIFEVDHLGIQISADALPSLSCGHLNAIDQQEVRILCFPRGGSSSDRDGHNRHYYGYRLDPPQTIAVRLNQSTSLRILELLNAHTYAWEGVSISDWSKEDRGSNKGRPEADMKSDQELRAETGKCCALVIGDICLNKQDLNELDQACALACVVLYFKKAVYRYALNGDRYVKY